MSPRAGNRNPDASSREGNRNSDASSREVYRNAWMRVREDDVVHPDGSAGIYGVVDKPDFSLVIPYDGRRLVVVEEFRYPVAERVRNFPQGSWPDDSAIPPAEVAAAELREETGLTAGRWEHLGRLLVAPGMSSQGAQVYLATDLSGELLPQEPGLVAESLTPAELDEQIRTGRFADGASVAAYLLLQLRHPELRSR